VTLQTHKLWDQIPPPAVVIITIVTVIYSLRHCCTRLLQCLRLPSRPRPVKRGKLSPWLWSGRQNINFITETVEVTHERHLRLRRPLLPRPRSSVMVMRRPLSSVSFSLSMAFFMSDDDANSTTLQRTGTTTSVTRSPEH